MAEINKIDLLKVDATLQVRKNVKSSTDIKTGFEDQLLQTVKQLENMGNEIEAMMESSAVQIKTIVKLEQNTRPYKLSPIDSVAENFSEVSKTSVKTAKNVAAEYEAMNQKKQT